MAQKMVVTNILTDKMIEVGAEFNRRLALDAPEISGCLWLYLEEKRKWRLVVVSPEVTTHGPKKIYQKLQSILSETPEELPRLTLSDTTVVKDTSPLIMGLRKVARADNAASGIRLYNTVVDGQWIEDAYIYRLE
jgi:hypothetical protein